MRNITATGIGLLLCATGFCAAAAGPPRDPRLGYWVEERISTSYPQAEGLQVSIEDLGGGVTRYKMGANHALANQQVVEFRCDGSPSPMALGNGEPLHKTYSCRILGPRAVEITTVPGNRDAAARTVLVETVSGDGSDLTGKWSSWDADGKVIATGSRHFTRRR